jgi:hypothetical protein
LVDRPQLPQLFLGDTLLLFLGSFLSIYICAAAVVTGFAIGCFIKPTLLLVSAMILAVVAFTVGYGVTSGVCSMMGI